MNFLQTHFLFVRMCEHPHKDSCIHILLNSQCTIAYKINGTPKVVYLAISKLHSILAVANLLAHNFITISYYGQVNSLKLKSSVALNGQVNPFGGAIYFTVDDTRIL